MADRRPIKQQHERAVVRDFLGWLNRRRKTRFVVIEEPDPPEAIIHSVRATSWVEVADAFSSSAFARDVSSYATLGEAHKPIGPGPYCGMDAIFAREFVKVLSNKLKKTSYLPYRQKYGSGYLVVSIQDPWFDANTIREMKALWLSGRPRLDQGCFKEVYIAFPSMNDRAFRRWYV